MLTSVIMPQMGESIFEGTVTKWLKKVGDRITRDEPLFEVSTDKVDSEIPSPMDGVLSEIVVLEGQTVKVGTVVAVIGKLDAAGETPILPEEEAAGVAPADEAVPAAEEVQLAIPSAEPAEAAVLPEAVPETAPAATPTAEAAPIEESTPGPEASPVEEAAPVTDAAPAAEVILVTESTPVHEASPREEAAPVTETTPAAETEAEAVQPPEIERHTDITEEPRVLIRTSPLVRRIARDYDVDLSVIRGTGLSGRITQQDIVGFLERHGKKEV
ncbi:MAG: biotin/lipoyl-containing protein, partial [Acidobacteriota bacterium]